MRTTLTVGDSLLGTRKFKRLCITCNHAFRKEASFLMHIPGDGIAWLDTVEGKRGVLVVIGNLNVVET